MNYDIRNRVLRKCKQIVIKIDRFSLVRKLAVLSINGPGAVISPGQWIE